MKAITIWQPYATLCVLGLKKIETRSWRASHRGPLAIHSAARWHLVHLLEQEPFRSCLRGVDELPLGAVVGIVHLVDVQPVERLSPSDTERAFGDYTHGRYGWLLDEPHRFEQPIPARGTQLTWEWDPPNGLYLPQKTQRSLFDR